MISFLKSQEDLKFGIQSRSVEERPLVLVEAEQGEGGDHHNILSRERFTSQHSSYRDNTQ